MANTDNPFGFRPVKPAYGTYIEVEEDHVKTGTTIYEGGIVCRNTTGELVGYSTTDAAVGNIVGVAAHYLVSATGADTLQYYSHPDQEYEAQSDDNSMTGPSIYKDRLFGVVNGTAGNTTTLQSKAEIDGDTGADIVGASASDIKPIHVLRVSGAIDNTTGAVSYTKYICKIAPPCHARGMAGAGLGTATGTAGRYGAGSD